MGSGTGTGTGSGSGSGGGVTGPGMPAFGGASGGTGGAAPVQGSTVTVGGVTYYLIVPSSYAASTPNPLLLVFSGTEGGAQMTSNLMNLSQTGIGGYICVVLDGVDYYGNGAAGATALDDVRSKYDVDNDRTYLLGESAGTTAALQLGFHLRQSYFAAYWANDVNASDAPDQTATQLGFQPWGQAGPGGDLPDADAIVQAMQAAGYRLPSPAPYAGAGSTSHGDLNQLVAALTSFSGQSRQ
jgi:poly(3-hydroxybutyrate) depolymerase